METQNNGRILAAELVGTAVLMLGGPGVAIFAGESVGILGVALGFGFALLIMEFVISPISGCHINPAVTLAMLLSRKVDLAHAVFAWIGQLIGAVGGAAIIYGIASGRDDFQRGQFAANLWSGEYYGVGAAIVAEVVFTAILVMVVLFTTTRRVNMGFGGITAGLTLALIHLISIPIDNTSVNPARSLGTALFAEWDTGAIEQLWVFIIFPLLGAVLGLILFLMLDDQRLEDTELEELPGLSDLRDALGKVSREAVDAVEDAVD